MQRLRRRARVSVAPERIRYLHERGVELDAEQALVVATEAAEGVVVVDGRVDGVLDGTEVHTGLNVSTVDVAPFLGKTDGEKLTDASGLDDGLVPTEKIGVYAVTAPYAISSPVGSVDVKSLTHVLIDTVTVTDTLADEQISIEASFALEGLGAGGGTLGTFLGSLTVRLLRGAITDPGAVAVADDRRVMAVSRDMRSHATVVIPGTDAPGAQSSVTYNVYGIMSSVTDITSVIASAQQTRVYRDLR